MLSERRIEANRRNAQKSTGPRTPEGKAVCSQNASRHRHLADTVLLACEDRKNFIRRCRRIHRELQPVGPVETVLVNEMVAALWRRDRVSILEARLLDHAYITTPEPLGFQPTQPAPDAPAPRPDHSPVAYRNALGYRDLADSSRVLPQLSRDSARHNRDFHRALATLERRRAARRKRNPQPEPNSPQTHRPTEPDRNGAYDRPIVPPPADPEFAPIPANLVGLLGSVSAPETAIPHTVETPQEPTESTVSGNATPPPAQSQPKTTAVIGAATAKPPACSRHAHRPGHSNPTGHAPSPETQFKPSKKSICVPVPARRNITFQPQCWSNLVYPSTGPQRFRTPAKKPRSLARLGEVYVDQFVLRNSDRFRWDSGLLIDTINQLAKRRGRQ